jgi:hypothetical protein
MYFDELPKVVDKYNLVNQVLRTAKLPQVRPGIS